MCLLLQEAAAVVDHIGDSAYDKNSKFSNAEDSLGALVIDDKDAMRSIEESLKLEDMDVCNIESSGENPLNAIGLGSDDKYLTSDNPYDIDLLTDKMEICEEVNVLQKLFMSYIKADIFIKIQNCKNRLQYI